MMTLFLLLGIKLRQTSTRGSAWPGCCIVLLPYKTVVSAQTLQERLSLCQKCLGSVEIQSWQRDKSQSATCDVKREEEEGRDGVTMRQGRARFGESEGYRRRSTT